jgi:hypothetical protein
MDPKDLVKVWDAPDHSQLTPKQISIRLPILASAKISALCEMYPSKSKSQIIGDLIATALDQVVDALPSKKGKYLGPDADDLYRDPDLEPYRALEGHQQEVGGVYEDIGPKGKFLRLYKKNLRELEKDLKIKEPNFCPNPIVSDDDFENE